jgi:antitoxin component YwqK of YwqJK toxin-antitoxin module
MRSLNLLTLSALLLIVNACQSTPQRRTPCDIVDETYVHKYGVEVAPDDWASRGQHGQVVSTLKNGVVVTKSYTGGILEGDTSYTFPQSSTIDKIETYSQGVLVKEAFNYISGSPKKEIIYPSPNQQMATTWYDNGSPMSNEEFINGRLAQAQYYNPNHQVEARVVEGEGIRIVRDDFGQKIASDTIKNGQLTIKTTYHPNGAPHEVISHANNEYDGEKRTYHPGGEPNTIETWNNGKLNGTFTVFQNGEIFSQIPYVNGKKNGIERHYKDGTVVVEEISWVNDQKHGPSNVYVGDKVQTNWFFQDKPVSKVGFDNLSHPQHL